MNAIGASLRGIKGAGAVRQVTVPHICPVQLAGITYSAVGRRTFAHATLLLAVDEPAAIFGWLLRESQ